MMRASANPVRVALCTLGLSLGLGAGGCSGGSMASMSVIGNP